jgi:hypothetical protein
MVLVNLLKFSPWVGAGWGMYSVPHCSHRVIKVLCVSDLRASDAGSQFWTTASNDGQSSSLGVFRRKGVPKARLARKIWDPQKIVVMFDDWPQTSSDRCVEGYVVVAAQPHLDWSPPRLRHRTCFRVQGQRAAECFERFESARDRMLNLAREKSS